MDTWITTRLDFLPFLGVLLTTVWVALSTWGTTKDLNVYFVLCFSEWANGFPVFKCFPDALQCLCRSLPMTQFNAASKYFPCIIVHSLRADWHLLTQLIGSLVDSPSVYLPVTQGSTLPAAHNMLPCHSAKSFAYSYSDFSCRHQSTGNHPIYTLFSFLVLLLLLRQPVMLSPLVSCPVSLLASSPVLVLLRFTNQQALLLSIHSVLLFCCMWVIRCLSRLCSAPTVSIVGQSTTYSQQWLPQ